MLKRIAGVPIFGGLLILSILIIHNPGCIEGSWKGAIAKNLKYGKKWVGEAKRWILERDVVSPKAAYGFLTLNSTYNK